MELVNSKRMLYTASHVATKLSPSDIRQNAGKPTGAFRKAGFLKSLELNREVLHRLAGAERLEDRDLDIETLKRIVTLSETVVARPEQYQVVAQKIASISDGALVAFAKLASAISDKGALIPAINAFEA